MTLSTYKRLEAAAIVLSIGLALASLSACIWLAQDAFWELVFLVGSVVPYLLIVNFLMKGYVWRNLAVNKVDQPAGLISVLMDRSRDFGDRHDAASDLAFYWYAPEVTDALTKVRGDPAEDPDIIEEARHSLSDIRRRQSETDRSTVQAQSTMTQTFVSYKQQDNIAVIQIDDGKRNALSPDVLRQIYAAFDRAEADKATVIITGRDDVFSAGFDLNVMRRGGPATLGMLRAGYGLTARVMRYPFPVITACNGHCLAMGVFLMLSTDYVIGTRGDFKISANEVAIGMNMPRSAAMVLENRLTPAAYQRAVNLAEYFDVDAALDAGFFDRLVESEDLMTTAEGHARELQKLDPRAHAVTKRRIRGKLTRKIRRTIPIDLIDAALQGLRAAKSRK